MTLTRLPSVAGLAALPLLLAGCAAAERDYPSLLPRVAERGDFSEPAAPPSVPFVADPALDARVAQARTALREAATAFDTVATRAERAARGARGAAAGSDPWLDAQTALGDLDTARSRQVEILSDLEQMASERGGALAAPYPTLDEAIATAQRAIEASATRIAAIQATLAPS